MMILEVPAMENGENQALLVRFPKGNARLTVTQVGIICDIEHEDGTRVIGTWAEWAEIEKKTPVSV